MASNDGFIAPPWWTTMSGQESSDYTRSRKPVTYTIDDMIGRPDYYKTTDQATASGIPGTILI